MPARPTGEIVLSTGQRSVLERLVRAPTTAQRLAHRARIILMSADGMSNVDQAAAIHGEAQQVRRWRRRWEAMQPAIAAAEDAEPEAHVDDLVVAVLSDEPGRGRKPEFTAEQVSLIIAVACESPSESKREVSHWTRQELADEAMKRGIVKSISPRHVGRLLEEVDLKPHLSRYWLNAKTKEADPEAFAAAVGEVCEVYRTAAEAHMLGEHVESTDEKTGIQALERAAPTKPARPGMVERFEHEYRRHGTLCLMANFEVATGEITSYTIGETRTEQDFANHIARAVERDPEGRWTFTADQLNTHQSATLVELVARWCGIDEDLGVKGASGVLHTLASRAAFLADPTHRVRFVYTPKHCSWLNQVEIWFSVLVRRLLKRSSFKSLDDLRTRIEAFIKYFNETLAKPYRWTYAGRPLVA
jgi:transposase